MSKPKPHFYRFPTAGLFADYRTLPPTELNVFRAARAFLAFADMDAVRMAGLLGAGPMLPVNLILEVLPSWKKYSRIAEEAFGTTVLEQLRQCVRLALNDGPSPKAYYLAGMAEHHGGAEIDNYIHDQFHETLIEFCRYAVQRLHGVQRELDDKMVFEQHCREFDLPCIETFLRVEVNGNVRQVTDRSLDRARHASSLFIKPARGSQGKSAERWDKCGTGYGDTSGTSVSDFDGLLNHLSHQAGAIGRDLLVQEAAVNPSRVRAFGGRALSTVRLVTFRTADGIIQPIHAGTRIACNDDAAVDNYHAGGIYFHVDYRTGLIGKGALGNFSDQPEYFSKAPASDHQLTGKSVEGWKQLENLAVNLHEKLTFDTVGGWDVALTDKGPVAVECNTVPGMSSNPQRYYKGFLGTEYSKKLCSEIVTFLDQLAPAGSRFRFRVRT